MPLCTVIDLPHFSAPKSACIILSHGEMKDEDMPSSSSSCPLSTQNGQRGVWLLKVPKFMATQWRQECQKAASSESMEPRTLGKVRITKASGKGPGGSIELLLPSADNGGQEKSFTLRETTDNSAPSFMFAHLAGRLSVEGQVKRKYDLAMSSAGAQDSLDPEYQRMNKERSQAAAAKNRTLQVIEPPKKVAQSRSVATAVARGQKIFFSSKAAPKKKFEKGQFERRARMEPDKLESKLFELFERQERWTLQKMVEETDQPAAYLKEVLPKIAKLNRSGPHARLWEVQSQYKTNAADQ